MTEIIKDKPSKKRSAATNAMNGTNGQPKALWFERVPLPTLPTCWEAAALWCLPYSYPAAIEFPNDRPGSCLTVRRQQLPPAESLIARDLCYAWAEAAEQSLVAELAADQTAKAELLRDLSAVELPTHQVYRSLAAIDRVDADYRGALSRAVAPHRNKLQVVAAQLRSFLDNELAKLNADESISKSRAVAIVALWRRLRGFRWPNACADEIIQTWRGLLVVETANEK
jgi:hypothetical protein